MASAGSEQILEHEAANSYCRRVGRLVLPGSNNRPATPHECIVRLPIPGPVAADLPGPPLSVGCGEMTVLGTAVPETPVDEDCHPRSGEDDVGSTPEIRERLRVHPKPKAHSVQSSSDCELRGRVPSGHPTHPGAHLWGGGSWTLRCPVRLHRKPPLG